eukprot:2173678-Lingulodinium_polyedra.AAC.1
MASSTTDSNVVPLLKKLAAPLNTLGRSERRLVGVLLQSGKSLLKELAEGHIRSVGDRPILVSYSSDGTPVQHKHK